MKQSLIKKNTIVFFTFILLVPYSAMSQLLIPPSGEWREIKPDSIIELTLKEIIEEGWNKNLSNITVLYPGGISYPGNLKKREAASYNLSVLITDLNANANMIIHKPVGQSQLETDNSLPVKSLNVQINNTEQSQILLNTIKQVLAEEFPKGGPSLKASKQVGYYIPNHKNCGDISIKWSMRKLRGVDGLNITIQCHQ